MSFFSNHVCINSISSKRDTKKIGKHIKFNLFRKFDKKVQLIEERVQFTLKVQLSREKVQIL